MTMRDRFASTVSSLLDDDPSTALILADISTQLFATARRSHPERVVNVGIMEQTMVGVAAGFAMEGFHPVLHSIAPFATERPYEQLKLDLAAQGLGATIVGVGGSYDYAAEGPTHHAPGDVAALLAIPRMQVLVPGHPDEVERLIRATYADGDPTYVRLSTAVNPVAVPAAPGSIHVLRRGGRTVVVAFGPMLSPTLEATVDLDLTIAYSASVEPFDQAGLRALVDGDVDTVIAVEPFLEGTTAGVIARALDRPVRLGFIGVPRSFIRSYGTAQDVERDLGLDPAGIARRLAAFRLAA
jgi:transketolase